MEMSNYEGIFESMQDFLKENWKSQSFTAFTNVQQQAIPAIAEGKDVIIESPTGTGKTLAYVLPLLNRISADSTNVQIVILAPTRELVMQIHQVVMQFSTGSSIRSTALIGGADIKRQMERLKKHPHVIVGTPGRILELANSNKLKLHHTKTIVVDEADQMLQLGFISIVQSIIKKTLKERQLIFLSATIPQQVEAIGKDWMKEPEIIRITQSLHRNHKVRHLFVVCEQRDKIDMLRRLVNIDGFEKVMVFVADTIKFDEVVSKLKYRGLKLDYLHGESSKIERAQVIKRFREHRIPILVTTDVAARGLDFPDVTHVIHFDLPEEKEKYVHRSGRTGRMDKEGTVISIITSNEVGRIFSFANKLELQLQERGVYEGKLVEVSSTNVNKKIKQNITKTK